MKLNQAHHIAIIGSDYEKSRHFYVDLLGFEVIRENYREARDDWKIDLALGDLEIELFIMKNCPKRPSYPEAYGLRHLAFRVESVEDTVRALEALALSTSSMSSAAFSAKRWMALARRAASSPSSSSSSE